MIFSENVFLPVLLRNIDLKKKNTNLFSSFVSPPPLLSSSVQFSLVQPLSRIPVFATP